MNKDPTDVAGGRLGAWLAELRRRKVIRVAAVYLVAGWLLIQVADATFDPLQLPDWALKLVIVLVVLGFPFACILAWAFDVTPRGLERTAPAAALDSPVGQAPVPGLPVGTVDSVAILPFLDMSPGRDQEYFCDGIAEEIINTLCCVRELRVASRTSSFQFKGRPMDVREIGRTLGVGAVLEGSVRKAGDRVRITAQLVNSADGYHLWSQSFDRELSDVFAIQSEIAQQLLRALKLETSQREARMIGLGGTTDAEAYDLYLRGRSQLRYGTTNLPAAQMFRRAIERDPDFAQAHAGLAHALAVRAMWRSSVDPAHIAEALAASRRALELEPLLPEAHVARACLHSLQGEPEAAAADFEQAIRLNPASSYTHYLYARQQFQAGRTERAVELFEAADRLEPGDYQVLSMLHTALRRLGDPDREREVGERAMRAIDEQLASDPDDSRALQLAPSLAAALGQQQRARALAEQALRARPDDIGTVYNAACTYAVIGDPDRAVELLARAVELGWSSAEWLAHDPDVDSLRADPRFQRIQSALRESTAS
ncbi:MAG TPA: tetratricopeptide repeat protein [Steroidobacteraceae bacterium]|nr:tetratricopeptide repeat protein [Steroidobacteraceae bacterium]